MVLMVAIYLKEFGEYGFVCLKEICGKWEQDNEKKRVLNICVKETKTKSSKIKL